MLNILPAKSSDLTELAKMNAQLIEDEGHRNSMTLEELHQRMDEWISSSYDAAIFKCEGELVGYALWRAESEYTYLRQFYIKPDFRRRGYGVNAFEQLREKYFVGDRLRLEVLIQNYPALEFWRAVGFSDYCMVLERENK